jgi:Predicted membrane protein
VIKTYNEKPVTLSAPEEYILQGDEIIVPLDRIGDGRLHRFVFTASDGTDVRFIVILKGAASYGVGLDACEICGPTGYYEKNGQVICILCDVVMNKETIGFKGGCNPVPLSYTISGGNMVIETADLEAEKGRFK